MYHRVGYELLFINEYEKASVADFFIPGMETQRNSSKKLSASQCLVAHLYAPLIFMDIVDPCASVQSVFLSSLFTLP